MHLVVITPVRNEQRYIGRTLRSMAAQTISPRRWVVVDDGSTDGTAAIVSAYLPRLRFLRLIRCSDRGRRLPGRGVVEAFYEGVRSLGRLRWDVVAKMDGDVAFGPDTLARLMRVFETQPRVGITGAMLWEPSGTSGAFTPRKVPRDTVGGPFKFYRRECFEQIGGLLPRAGWDGVDIIRAAMHGWETGEQHDVAVHHLKPTGMAAGEGVRKACGKYGDTAYYFGGYFWYFLLRVVLRSVQMRNPLSAWYMLEGYVQSMYEKAERQTPEFRAFLKRRQIRRAQWWMHHLRGALGGVSAASPAKVDP